MADMLSSLPGDIEGLLLRGSPVLWSDLPIDHQMYRAWPMVVCRLWDRAGEPLADLGGGQTGQPLRECALDLTDSTGRVHAAWWANERAQTHLWPTDPRGENEAIMLAMIGQPMTLTQIDTLARLVLQLAGRS